MKKNRLAEFFQDTDGQLSLTRLLMFLAFFPSSYVVIIEHSADVLWPFLSVFGSAYVGGKAADGYIKRGSLSRGPQRVNIENVEKANIPGDGTNNISDN